MRAGFTERPSVSIEVWEKSAARKGSLTARLAVTALPRLPVKKPPSPSSPSSDPGVIDSKSTSGGPPRDVVLVHGLTDDRKGLKVLRARSEGIEVGEVRPLSEGQPISSDVVRLRPRKETPYICDVETTYSPPRKNSGPAQVATRAYRDNWDQIWSSRASAPGSVDLN